MGVDHTHISKWEIGTFTPSAENLKKLADILGVTTSQLMDKATLSTVSIDQVKEDIPLYFEDKIRAFNPDHIQAIHDYVELQVEFLNKFLKNQS